MDPHASAGFTIAVAVHHPHITAAVPLHETSLLSGNGHALIVSHLSWYHWAPSAAVGGWWPGPNPADSGVVGPTGVHGPDGVGPVRKRTVLP